MNKKSVRDLEVRGRKVLIRADLNVPLNDQQQVTDDRRIRMFLPTLKHVIDNGGRAIVMSHLGRPSGDPQEDARLSLKPVADKMSELLGKQVNFCSDTIGEKAENAAAALNDGDVLLLENLRFHKAETVIDKKKKNPDGKLTDDQEQQRQQFADALARLGDAYVNDAFGTCHRNHVSMYDIPTRMQPGNRAVGFLVEKEIEYLGKAVESPHRDFVAILGGAKVSDKIGVIQNLLKKVDRILVGGAMMFTFWKAQGKPVGRSLCEEDKLDLANELIKEGGNKLQLPFDAVAAAELKQGVQCKNVSGSIPDDLMGLDIGPETLATFKDAILQAKTIVWNGPVGAFETKPFDKGTFEIAHAIAEATDRGAVSVIGGGDSAAAIEQAGLADRITHISTGGGASLKFLEGKKFDPIEVLDDA